jgi:hypothetical protein
MLSEDFDSGCREISRTRFDEAGQLVTSKPLQSGCHNNLMGLAIMEIMLRLTEDNDFQIQIRNPLNSHDPCPIN